jgi:hypothetical protein
MAAYTFPSVPGSYVVGDTVQFNYSGAVQTWSASNSSRVKIELWGARGGYGYDTPGSGGYAYGEYLTSNGSTLNVYVGGIGGDAYQVRNSSTLVSGAGYNGGGERGHAVSGSVLHAGAGGGGATDVRRTGTALSDRILIAGGGGGSGTRNVQLTARSDGGAGGGGGFLSQNGNPGYTSSARGIGLGGTQSAGGSGGVSNSGSSISGASGTLGTGGKGGDDSMFYTGASADYNYSGPGGGGGYYGGGGGGGGGIDGRGNAGAGGGSGFINTSLITKFGGESGVRFDNGLAIITILAT